MSVIPVFLIPPVILPMQYLRERQFVLTIPEYVAVFPSGQNIVTVTPQQNALAWLACLLALGLVGCASHRGLGLRGVCHPAEDGIGRAGTSQALGSTSCAVPCPPLRCRLWGISCRLRGILGDVRWLLREGIVGGPDQDIPPGPTPPPILDEFFPLPTRPVFYPNAASGRAEYADWAGEREDLKRGESASTPVTRGHPLRDDSQERSPAKDALDTGVPDTTQPEVIPLPAPLPPGDSFDSPDPNPFGGNAGRPDVWDSAGWRTSGAARATRNARGGRADAVAFDRGRALDAGGGPAWVFLPTAPVVADGPRVTISSDSVGDRSRKSAAVRR